MADITSIIHHFNELLSRLNKFETSMEVIRSRVEEPTGTEWLYYVYWTRPYEAIGENWATAVDPIIIYGAIIGVLVGLIIGVLGLDRYLASEKKVIPIDMIAGATLLISIGSIVGWLSFLTISRIVVALFSIEIQRFLFLFFVGAALPLVTFYLFVVLVYYVFCHIIETWNRFHEEWTELLEISREVRRRSKRLIKAVDLPYGKEEEEEEDESDGEEED